MKKTLSKWLYEMKRKAHGTQKPRHANGAVEVLSPEISWGFVARQRKGAWIQGARSEGDEGILDDMSRRPNKRNAVDMPHCVAVVEAPRNFRASTAQRGDSLVQTFNQRFLKRAANPLLILLKYSFMAFLDAPARSACAGDAGAALRRTPLCYIYRQGESMLFRAIFRTSSSPRSCNPARLGEERISGLAHGFIFLIFCMFCLTASYAAADEAAMSVATDEISAIIRAEIMAMPEWKGADIRVEITGGIKNDEILAPGDSFRLAPTGLTIGRRNVIAPIYVIRDEKVVRFLSVPAVVYISATAFTASREIASGETISEKDILESRVETTDIGVAFIRDPKEIEGKIARRTSAAGGLLSSSAFTEAPLVRRGELVNVRLERDGITLTSTARASENGQFGDVIQVKSVDFSSVIKARVTGQSQVSVQ